MPFAQTAKKVKGKLLLDSRAGLLKGGEGGAVVVPGQPEKSRLIEAIGYKNVDLQMPPRAKLPDAVIADFTAWVKMGAPWGKEIGRQRTATSTSSTWPNANRSTGPGGRSASTSRPW